MNFSHGTCYCLIAISLTVVSIDAQANHDIIFNEPNEQWIEGDFDLHDQDALRHLATETDAFGFRQQLSFAKSGHGIEDRQLVNIDNVQTLDAAYHLAGLYLAPRGWEIYAGLEFSFEAAGDNSTIESLDIDALYALRRFGSNRQYMGFGRQEVEDDRAWMIDEHIDGVSYVMEADNFALTGFIGSHNQMLEKLIGTHEQHSDHHTKPHDYIAYGRVYRALDEDKQGSAYIAFLSDKDFEQGERNIYLGLRSLGDFSDNGSYWAEAAFLTGNSETRDIRAYAFDVGISYNWNDAVFRPGYTLGFAYGSGDDGIGSDNEFRQTGIHANESVLTGVVDLKYYGRVLDPRLSNLQIITLGLNMRPRDRFSVDLLYNGYWQIHPSTDIKADGIDVSANGSDHYIGSGLDLVAGLRNWSNLSISLVYGRFHGNDGVNADVGRLEFNWNL